MQCIFMTFLHTTGVTEVTNNPDATAHSQVTYLATHNTFVHIDHIGISCKTTIQRDTVTTLTSLVPQVDIDDHLAIMVTARLLPTSRATCVSRRRIVYSKQHIQQHTDLLATEIAAILTMPNTTDLVTACETLDKQFMNALRKICPPTHTKVCRASHPAPDTFWYIAHKTIQHSLYWRAGRKLTQNLLKATFNADYAYQSDPHHLRDPTKWLHQTRAYHSAHITKLGHTITRLCNRDNKALIVSKAKEFADDAYSAIDKTTFHAIM